MTWFDVGLCWLACSAALGARCGLREGALAWHWTRPLQGALVYVRAIGFAACAAAPLALGHYLGGRAASPDLVTAILTSLHVGALAALLAICLPGRRGAVAVVTAAALLVPAIVRPEISGVLQWRPVGRHDTFQTLLAVSALILVGIAIYDLKASSRRAHS